MDTSQIVKKAELHETSNVMGARFELCIKKVGKYQEKLWLYCLSRNISIVKIIAVCTILLRSKKYLSA